MDASFCATELSTLFVELFHICNILYAQLYCNIKMQFIHRFVIISKNHLEFLVKTTNKKNFPLCANALQVLSELWVLQEKVDMKISAFSFASSFLIFGYL